MESEFTKENENEKRTDDEDSAICPREKGDKLCQEQNYEEALECYNKAIEQDKSNVELLSCRLQVYFLLKNYTECIKEAGKLVALCASERKSWKSLVVSDALYFMAVSHTWLRDADWHTKALKAFERAFQIDFPVREIESGLEMYNKWKKGWTNESASGAALEVGIMRYSCGDTLGAIEEFTKAISFNHGISLAYACRASCYAEDGSQEISLINDVKECIEQDYRYFNFFIEKADELKILGQLAASFRIHKALGLAEAAYKISVGRFFPKLLHDKQLNKSEKKRFERLDESWRKKFLPTLERLNQDSDSDSDSDSGPDSKSDSKLDRKVKKEPREN